MRIRSIASPLLLTLLAIELHCVTAFGVDIGCTVDCNPSTDANIQHYNVQIWVRNVQSGQWFDTGRTVDLRSKGQNALYWKCCWDNATWGACTNLVTHDLKLVRPENNQGSGCSYYETTPVRMAVVANGPIAYDVQYDWQPPAFTGATYTAEQCNTTAGFIGAWWRQNGVIKKSVVLGPGECESYTFNYNTNDGSNVTLEWGFDQVIPKYISTDGNTIEFTNEVTSVTNEIVNPPLVNTNITAPTTVINGSTYIRASQAQTNGPVQWDENTSDLAREATLRSGINTLASIDLERNRLLGLMNEKIARLGPGATGAFSTTITNSEKYASNIWHAMTHGNPLAPDEGEMPGFFNGTNLAAGIIAGQKQLAEEEGEGSALQNFIDAAIPSEPTIPEGTPALTLTMNLATGARTLNFGAVLERFLPLFASIRAVMVWVIYLLLFLLNFTFALDTIMKTAQTPQVTSIGQQVLGTNVKLAGAIIVAAIIAAFLFTLPALAWTEISYNLDLANTASGAVSGITSSPVYNFVRQLVPFGVAISAFFSHLVLRMILQPLAALICIYIKFLVGV